MPCAFFMKVLVAFGAPITVIIDFFTTMWAVASRVRKSLDIFFAWKLVDHWVLLGDPTNVISNVC